MSKKVILKKGKDHSLKRFHPWVFSGAIQKMDKGVRNGDLVEVKSEEGSSFGFGHYQDGGIAIRMISFDLIDNWEEFWLAKMTSAYASRKATGIIDNDQTNCYRLIHAEGDGLPGLIIDIYDKRAVIQCHSIGMYKSLQKICDALHQVYNNQLVAIYHKSKNVLPRDYAAGVTNHYLHGDASSCPAMVLEHGRTFEVNWEEGQKTGFFLDQRDNRLKMTDFVKGKKVLNAFSYSGGFSVFALSAGAAEVHSVDISGTATALGDKNVSLNPSYTGTHKTYTTDVMDYLKDTTEQYDVMIVDPPAFAKSMKKRHNAVQAYKRLNALALEKITAGGILSTYSCSQVVDNKLFYDTVKAAAIQAGRSVRVLHRLSQPSDHPVSLFHDESSYLKGLILYVE